MIEDFDIKSLFEKIHNIRTDKNCRNQTDLLNVNEKETRTEQFSIEIYRNRKHKFVLLNFVNSHNLHLLFRCTLQASCSI